jgi:formate hydrogenlyase transcriptional activator
MTGDSMDTPSVRGPESAEKRLDFEVLISDLSARFVNVPAGQVDREIEEALGRLLAFFDVDRCGLIEILQDLGEAHITHVALKDGIPSVPMGIDLIRLYPWSAVRLLRDAEVINLHTRDYPPEAVVDRASNEAMKTRTNLSIPLLYGGAVRYLIAITAVREERTWPAEYISRFRLVGEIFVNALMRERTDRELQRSLEDVRALKDRCLRYFANGIRPVRVGNENCFLQPLYRNLRPDRGGRGSGGGDGGGRRR